MLGPQSARRLPQAHAHVPGYSSKTYSDNDDEYDEYLHHNSAYAPQDPQTSASYSSASANPPSVQHPRRVRQDNREPTNTNQRLAPSYSPTSPDEHTSYSRDAPRTSSRPASPSYRDATPSNSQARVHFGANTSSASSSQQPAIALTPQPRSRESSKNALEHQQQQQQQHHHHNNYYGVGTVTSALDRLNSTRRLMAQLDPDDAESIAPDRGTWASDWRESIIDRDRDRNPNRISFEMDEASHRNVGQGHNTRNGAGFPRNSSTSVVTVDGGDPFPYSAYDGVTSYDDSIEDEVLAPFPTTTTSASNQRPSPLNLIPPGRGGRTESQQTVAPSSAPFRIGDNSPSTEAFLSDPRALLASTPTRDTSLVSEESSRLNRPDHIAVPPTGASSPSLPGSGSPTWSMPVAQTGRVASRTSARNFSRPFVAVEDATAHSELAVPPLPPQHGRNLVLRSESSDSIDQLARQSSLGHSSSVGHSTSGHESSMGHGAPSQGGHSMSSSWEERRLMGLRGVELAKREMLLKTHSGEMERLQEEEKDESTERRGRYGGSSGASSPERKSHLPTPDASPAISRQLPAFALSSTSHSGSGYPERSSSTHQTSPTDRSPHLRQRGFDRDASPTSPSARPLPVPPSQGQSPSSTHLTPSLDPSGSSSDPRVSVLENPRAPPAPPLHLLNSPAPSSHYSGFDRQSSSPVETRSAQMPSLSTSPPRQRNVLRKRRPSDAAARSKDGLTPPQEGTIPSLPRSTALAIEVALREDPFAVPEGHSGRWAKFRSRSHGRSSKSKIRPSYGSEADTAAEYEREADSASVPHITFEPPNRPMGDLRDLALRAKQLSEQRRALEALSLKPSVAKSAAAGIVQRGDGSDLAPEWVQKEGDGDPEDEMESLAAKSVIRPPGIGPKQRSISDQGPQRSYSDASEEEHGLSVSASHARPGTSNSLYSDYSIYSLPTTTVTTAVGGSKPGSIISPTVAQQASLTRAPSSMSISHPTFQKAKAGRKVEMITTAEGEVVPRNEPQTCEDYLLLGIHYHENGELPRAAWYFEQSAKQDGGCPAGMLMHGLTLRHGWGCQVNTQLGFKYLQAAAESVVEDIDQEKAGDHGLRDAKASKVGIPICQVGNSESGALNEHPSVALQNELVLALHEIGVSFRFGWGVPRDKKMAVAYFTLAADLGDVDAQTDLAFCYANGKGCKKDLRMAAHYYRLAVKQGAESFGLSWIWKAKYD
ncbi:BQ2448_3228 [Microbotryum intermedium]|uniref:BQ2448_3228 protein n=1 Tax=Microbotryum intermedium TaxID=269621 RepID=A0A238FCS7_9BASI|nr:BQ2448_3228 [Microbotryum intermedium]